METLRVYPAGTSLFTVVEAAVKRKQPHHVVVDGRVNMGPTRWPVVVCWDAPQASTPRNASARRQRELHDFQCTYMAGGKAKEECMLQYVGTVQGHSARFLIDSGANANFISAEFAAEHSLPSHRTTLHRIRIANSKTLTSSLLSQGLEIRLGTYVDQVNCLHTPSLPYDVILGKPWLTQRNPRIDWETNEVTLDMRGVTHRLITTMLPPRRVIEVNATTMLKHLTSSQSAAWVFAKDRDPGHNAALYAVDAMAVDMPGAEDSSPLDEGMRNVLEQHADVFKEIPGVGPSRPYDHPIELEEGARPVAQKRYKMGEAELVELRTQLDLYLAKGWIQPSASPYSAP
ncbi:MAG: retropepsin-like aspartic protease, partial [Gaiellaceae bacterium]